MTQSSLKIEVKGLDELNRAMKKFPRRVIKNWSAAGKESAEDIILPTEGLRNYPPETGANVPPTPYYIRSRGTQTSSVNYGNSERLGTRWNVTRRGLQTKISNPVSYAKWVHGEEQALAMTQKGKKWRKIFEVAKEKTKAIQRVYQKWIGKTLREVRLK